MKLCLVRAFNLHSSQRRAALRRANGLLESASFVELALVETGWKGVVWPPAFFAPDGDE